MAANEEGNKDVTPLMTHVMFALTTAKGSYKNNVWFYDSKLHEKEKTENYVESHMHQALREESLSSICSRKWICRRGGLRALRRWSAG